MLSQPCHKLGTRYAFVARRKSEAMLVSLDDDLLRPPGTQLVVAEEVLEVREKVSNKAIFNDQHAGYHATSALALITHHSGPQQPRFPLTRRGHFNPVCVFEASCQGALHLPFLVRWADLVERWLVRAFVLPAVYLLCPLVVFYDHVQIFLRMLG
ncbi:uncharacterized protein DEA37_0000116 [Paragonimus westermani]|uniref:Uncharacterized protein n=1 Tax=Paragonimus westermani TaxID=34504 RepID=A0A5J4NB59_9TREM|nr:uncharacterized protein DEA37_0000116 [Paragonimus westermani]